MITVEVKANGNLIKHIWGAEDEHVWEYEYYKPGSNLLITGKILKDKEDTVDKVIMRMFEDIRDQKKSLTLIKVEKNENI